MPFPKENEPTKKQGDKLEHAVDQVAPDRSDRKPGQTPRKERSDKVERERGSGGDDDEV